MNLTNPDAFFKISKESQVNYSQSLFIVSICLRVSVLDARISKVRK